MDTLRSRLTSDLAASGAACDWSAALAFGHPEGVQALVAPCSTGLWMGASEAGEPLLFLLARRREGSPFDPETDLEQLGGPLWEAILGSQSLEPSQRKTRAWETWAELFEGLSPRPLEEPSEPETPATPRRRPGGV